MNPARGFTLSLFQLFVLKLFHSFPLLMAQTMTVTLQWYFTSSCCVLPTSRRSCETFVPLGPGGCASLKSVPASPLSKKHGGRGVECKGAKKLKHRSSSLGGFLEKCWIDQEHTLPFFTVYHRETGLAKSFDMIVLPVTWPRVRKKDAKNLTISILTWVFM